MKKHNINVVASFSREIVDTKGNYIKKYLTKEHLREAGVLDIIMSLTDEVDENTNISTRIRLIVKNKCVTECCPKGHPLKLNRETSVDLFSDYCVEGDSCEATKNKKTLNRRKLTYPIRYGEKKANILLTKELFQNYYNESSKSPTKMADDLGVPYSVVKKMIENHKINHKDAVGGPHTAYWTNETFKIMNSVKLLELFIHKNQPPTNAAKILGVSYDALLKKLHYHGLSKYVSVHCPGSEGENEVASFLDSIGVSYDKNVFGLIENSRKEIDIYIPEYNLAIEFDGVYWHTETKGKDKKYHVEKTDHCAKKGIKLLHIWDNEWNSNKDVWQSVILSAVGKTTRIYGRSCEVGFSAPYEFFVENHLQGDVHSNNIVSLWYKNEVVAAMSFCKSRFSKKYDWELLRFCNKKGTTVVGGASKCLAHFRKRHEGSIVSYANRRWSDGGLYRALGFQELHISQPNYFYTKNFSTFYSRNKFQKHKLGKMLDVFDSSLTEWENMKANGYDRIWDCGNYVFCLDKEP